MLPCPIPFVALKSVIRIPFGESEHRPVTQHLSQHARHSDRGAAAVRPGLTFDLGAELQVPVRQLTTAV